MMKSFKGRHKDLDQGEDMRNPQHLIKAKEKRLQQKMKNMTKEERRASGPRTSTPMDKFSRGKSNVSVKTRNKIIQGMRPTRSKMIIRGGGGDFAGKKRGRGKRWEKGASDQTRQEKRQFSHFFN